VSIGSVSEAPAVTAARQIYQEVKRPEVLILATLLHDIGKSHTVLPIFKKGEEEHTDASSSVYSLVFSTDYILGKRKETLSIFWSQHHLVMSDIAQHRDFEEDRILRSFGYARSAMSGICSFYS